MATDPLTQRLEIHQVREPVQWSQEFLARQMRNHKRKQARALKRLMNEVIEEVLALPTPAPTKRSLFAEGDEHAINVH